MSGYLQTCGACGHTGPLRYDNRKNRRCENCWERVEGDTFEGVTPEEQATPAPAKEESEPTPTKTTTLGAPAHKARGQGEKGK